MTDQDATVDRGVLLATAELVRLRREWPGMTFEDARAVNAQFGILGRTRTAAAGDLAGTDDDAAAVSPRSPRLHERDLRRAWDLATEAL